MHVRIWLILWIIGLLFPIGALANYSNVPRVVNAFVYGPEWVHILLHAILYAVFSILVLQILKRPLNRHTALVVLVTSLGVGCLQEIIQAISRGNDLRLPITLLRASFDLLIDMIGGLLGLAAFTFAQTRKRLANQHKPNNKGGY